MNPGPPIEDSIFETTSEPRDDRPASQLELDFGDRESLPPGLVLTEG